MSRPCIKPYSQEWEREANLLARDYVPDIYPCGKCGYPVIRNYCCTYCGDTNPDETYEQEAEFERKYHHE